MALITNMLLYGFLHIRRKLESMKMDEILDSKNSDICARSNGSNNGIDDKIRLVSESIRKRGTWAVDGRGPRQHEEMIDKVRVPNNKYEINHAFGKKLRYTRDVRDPEFLIPRRVFEDGSLDTYSLPNFYDRRELSERKKRSTEAGEQEPQTDKVHLVLPFNGIEHHVELSPYHEFISPDMVIETRGAGLRTNLDEALRFKRAPDRQCHYRGFVRDHQKSKAALSLCDGVVGYVQTDHDRYFIEPVNEAEPQQDGQHVHIAYKRDVLHESGGGPDHGYSFCGTSDNWEAAWAEQLAKREKRLMEENLDKATSYSHSIHRFLEIGLIADRRFLDFYNNSNYEQYLLTIMNMVSDLYHDGSVGNQIDVVIVRIIYLEKEKEEIDLMISPKAETTLASFTKWAQKMNPKDHTHPNHFDIAVLVTRYDICSETATHCNLLGLAYVGTACDPEKAACITEDTGLLLGVVIAHEVGHVMGCSHDEVNISGCESKDKDGSYFVMSPIVNIHTYRWSPCSRRYITNLLETGLGECLINDPRNPPEKFKYPGMLAGAMYDGNFQCDMSMPGSKICPGNAGLNAMCEMLWCAVANTTCYTKGSAMAEGSKCGENMWCIHKKCVPIGTRPAAVHGGWGKWGPMNSCSRTCGGGLKYAERECDNPPPANNGRYCLGERKRFTLCNTMPCDYKKPSFRQVQCSIFNDQDILSDGKHNWTAYPIHDATIDPCELYCINENFVYTKLQPSANDSTPCKGGTNNICIGGKCRKVGCDWVLGSDAIYDRCGICKGASIVYMYPEPRREEIQIKGPIAEDIRLEYIFFKRNENPGIRYEYYVLSSDPSYKPKYLWDFMEWSECSVKCGGGTMISEAACIEEHGGKVSPTFCEGIPRPDPKSRVCNSEPCLAKWRVSQWSKCSACDRKKGKRHRKVQCVRAAARVGQDDVQANLNACKGRVPRQEEECIGKRPCKKICRKMARNANEEVVVEPERKQSLHPEERAKMVDKFVDLSLARYLEKSYGVPREAEDSRTAIDTADFRQLLREWSLADEEKRKRGACDRNVSTPKPGTIIKDSVPVEDVVLLEAPYLEENLQTNLSDRAFQEVGDIVGGSIDTSRVKMYTGTKAVEMIERLEGRNLTGLPLKKENYSYAGLSKIVDLADQQK
ncbi:A disintegrin and metalloproteinase with thrombospondin motifs 7-like [Frieseomelitta varia]|uniref:A disintegrin and metalloproteinase with thrombospondin motifs 7-like n=1 Tax=Frieseomelitta varia TaxID=561572 RepID=UPI001CB67F96|nr:A disintegrin and metalloproteinase with thrombospondin motifs 7-like [Frieseomelitta varia]